MCWWDMFWLLTIVTTLRKIRFIGTTLTVYQSPEEGWLFSFQITDGFLSHAGRRVSWSSLRGWRWGSLLYQVVPTTSSEENGAWISVEFYHIHLKRTEAPEDATKKQTNYWKQNVYLSHGHELILKWSPDGVGDGNRTHEASEQYEGEFHKTM